MVQNKKAKQAARRRVAEEGISYTEAIHTNGTRRADDIIRRVVPLADTFGHEYVGGLTPRYLVAVPADPDFAVDPRIRRGSFRDDASATVAERIYLAFVDWQASLAGPLWPFSFFEEPPNGTPASARPAEPDAPDEIPLELALLHRLIDQGSRYLAQQGVRVIKDSWSRIEVESWPSIECTDRSVEDVVVHGPGEIEPTTLPDFSYACDAPAVLGVEELTGPDAADMSANEIGVSADQHIVEVGDRQTGFAVVVATRADPLDVPRLLVDAILQEIVRTDVAVNALSGDRRAAGTAIDWGWDGRNDSDNNYDPEGDLEWSGPASYVRPNSTRVPLLAAIRACAPALGERGLFVLSTETCRLDLGEPAVYLGHPAEPVARDFDANLDDDY